MLCRAHHCMSVSCRAHGCIFLSFLNDKKLLPWALNYQKISHFKENDKKKVPWAVCVSLFYVIDTGSIGSRAQPGG